MVIISEDHEAREKIVILSRKSSCESSQDGGKKAKKLY